MSRNPGDQASTKSWLEELTCCCNSDQHKMYVVSQTTATGCGDEAEVHPPGFRRRNHFSASNAASMRDVNKPSLLLSSGQKEKMLKRHAATTGALSVPQTHICMRHDVICMPRSHLDKSQAKNYK